MKSVLLGFNGLWMQLAGSKQKGFDVTLFRCCKLKDSKFVKSNPAELWQNYIQNYKFRVLLCLFVS